MTDRQDAIAERRERTAILADMMALTKDGSADLNQYRMAFWDAMYWAGNTIKQAPLPPDTLADLP